MEWGGWEYVSWVNESLVGFCFSEQILIAIERVYRFCGITLACLSYSLVARALELWYSLPACRGAREKAAIILPWYTIRCTVFYGRVRWHTVFCCFCSWNHFLLVISLCSLSLSLFAFVFGEGLIGRKNYSLRCVCVSVCECVHALRSTFCVSWDPLNSISTQATGKLLYPSFGLSRGGGWLPLSICFWYRTYTI